MNSAPARRDLHSAARRADAKFAGPLFASTAVLGLVVSLYLDVFPRFFLGDSESYLTTSYGGHLPDDRSWSYGLAITNVLQHTHKLASIPLIQIFSVWASSLLVVSALGKRFKLNAFFCAVSFLVLFFNPLDFYWSRAIMTDEWAVCCLYLIVFLLFWFEHSLLVYVGVFILAFLLASLRIVYLVPLIVGFSAALILLLFARLALSRAVKVCDLKRLGSYVVCFVAAHFSYGLVDSAVLNKPGFFGNHAAGSALLSSWSPLLASRVNSTELSTASRSQLLPLTWENRVPQLYAQNGIINLIRKSVDHDETAAQAEYRRLLEVIVIEDPLALTYLIAHSWSDYLNPGLVTRYHRELRWSGATDYNQPNSLSNNVTSRLSNLGISRKLTPDLPSVGSASLSYFAIGAFWPLLLSWFATFVAPVISIALAWQGRDGDVIAIQLFGFAYMAAIAASSNDMVTRYLLPLGIVFVTGAACLLANTMRRADQVTSVSLPA